jgi:glucan phosphorylase
MIGNDGAQQDFYPYSDLGQLPITPLRKPDGEWLRLEVPLPGYPVWLRAWQVQVGHVKLYLGEVCHVPGALGGVAQSQIVAKVDRAVVYNTFVQM